MTVSAVTAERQAPNGWRTLERWTALVLVLDAVFVTIPVLVLGAVFEFPDILRDNADRVLPLFAQNSRVIVPAYYVFMLSSVLLVPLVLLLRRVLSRAGSPRFWTWPQPSASPRA